MSKIFDDKDRQEALEYIISAAKECKQIVSLVQVGSGAYGFRDAKSDLDFVIALDSDTSMSQVMDYIKCRISDKYTLAYSTKTEAQHLQVFVLSNLLEIDIGYGGYEHAAARKADFKVLYDQTGVVEEKMIQSREWMDDRIYGDKLKRDIELARTTAWAHMMHAAVAIQRDNYLRAVGELEYIRKLYVDLLGDRYRLESGMNHDMDKLPDEEKAAVRSTYVFGETTADLWISLMKLTELIYKELDGIDIPVSQDEILEYYNDVKEA